MKLLPRRGIFIVAAGTTLLTAAGLYGRDIPHQAFRAGETEMTQKFPSGIRTERPGIAFYVQSKDDAQPWHEVSISRLREVLASMDGAPKIRELALQYIASCDSTSPTAAEDKKLRQEEKQLRLALFHEAGLLFEDKFPDISGSFYGLITHEFLHNVEQELDSNE